MKGNLTPENAENAKKKETAAKAGAASLLGQAVLYLRLLRPPRPRRFGGAISRREFLRGLGRNAALAGLAAVAAGLIARGGRAGGSERCINQGICRGCGVFEDCHLPAAFSAKQAMKA